MEAAPSTLANCCCRQVLAETLVIATGAVAKRLEFPGAGEQDGFWNKGISACAVCETLKPRIPKT